MTDTKHKPNPLIEELRRSPESRIAVRDRDTKRKPTPGAWEAKIEDHSERGWCVYDATGMLVARRLSADNANLIAEAGTVHHETGLTPRQLLAAWEQAVVAADLAARVKS